MNVEIYKAIVSAFMVLAAVLASSPDTLIRGVGIGFFCGVLAGGMLVGHAALQARKKRKN